MADDTWQTRSITLLVNNIKECVENMSHEQIIHNPDMPIIKKAY